MGHLAKEAPTALYKVTHIGEQSSSHCLSALTLNLYRRAISIPTSHPSQLSTPYPSTALAPPSFPNHPRLAIFMVGCSKGFRLLTVLDYARCWTFSKYKRRRMSTPAITFDIPDDVLVEIFDFYLREDVYRIQKWIRLAHVCRRWRSIVFQSPLRLNLQLVCTHKTPTRDLLDIWPSLPLVIRDFDNYGPDKPFIEDNIIAALEHNDRVCKIEHLSKELGYFINSAAILKPFPELTVLQLCVRISDEMRIIPNSFLGGSAPRLRYLCLNSVPFPGLPKLLLSATHLAYLYLVYIPRSGYIPPETMATSLSALTSLKSLPLHFQYPQPRPAPETRRRPPPPLICSILPSLTEIDFLGSSEYLEVILARIDSPRLNKLRITFFNQLIFNAPVLFRFISRRPTLRTRKMGRIVFYPTQIYVGFPSHISAQISDYNEFNVGIRCTSSEWQLSSLQQVCTSFLPPVSTLEDLYISGDPSDRLYWQDDVEHTLWLDLLRPFVAVKNLYISEEFVPRIAPALQELVEGRTAEALLALDNIFLEGFRPLRPLQEGLKKFVAARLLTSRPVSVSRWDRQRKLKLWGSIIMNDW